MSKLLTIPGVGKVTAEKLQQGGVEDIDAVADAAIELLVQLTGFYEARAASIRDAARDLAVPGESAQAELMPDEAPEPAAPPKAVVVKKVKSARKPRKKLKRLKKQAKALEKAANKLRKAAKKAKRGGKKKKAKRLQKEAKAAAVKAQKRAKKAKKAAKARK